jgi:hypothetical protein
MQEFLSDLQERLLEHRLSLGKAKQDVLSPCIIKYRIEGRLAELRFVIGLLEEYLGGQKLSKSGKE